MAGTFVGILPVNTYKQKGFISLLLPVKIQHMNKLLCITGFITILLTKNAAAQYYYKDIVSNEQARTEKKVWEEKR